MRIKVNTALARASQGWHGGSRAIAKAPNGTIWVAYVNTDAAPNQDIRVAYSKNGGETWYDEMAVENDDLSAAESGANVTRNVALVVTSDSIPHLFYLNAFEGGERRRIRYTKRVGGSWNVPQTAYTVDAPTNLRPLSVCVDSNDNFHIVVDSSGGLLDGLVLYWTAAGIPLGLFETVDSNGQDPDIAITSTNLPVVTYQDEGGLIYNDRTGGAWTNEAIVSSVGSPDVPWVVVDSADNVHVVWTETMGIYNGIKYRKRTSGVWGTEQTVISSAVDDYGNPIVGVDTSDTIYVVYQFELGTTQEETVWYKTIISEVVGDETVLDALATQPNSYPSVYAYLYHRFPSSGILLPGASPGCVLLDENGVNADLYFIRLPSTMPAGNIAVVGTRLHYIDKTYNIERYRLGVLIGASTMPSGDLSVKDTELHYVDKTAGAERYIQGTLIGASSLPAGGLAIVATRGHYVGKDGNEYYWKGTIV